MVTGFIKGTQDRGACGTVPVVAVGVKMPKLRNNGYACFSGCPEILCPELANHLPNEPGRPIRQGYVVVQFADGKEFLTYASTLRAPIYSFS